MKNASYLILMAMLTSCTSYIANINPQTEWLTKDSASISVYYRASNYNIGQSPSDSVVSQIIREQNRYYGIIQDSIRRRYNEKILIYLFNRDEAYNLIGTNGGGLSVPKYNSFYYTYINNLAAYTDKYQIKNPTIGAHELIHVITHKCLGYPGTKMMSEGYAVWLDGSYGRKNISEIIKYYRDNSPKKIMLPDLMIKNETIPESIYYPNVGTFIAFLVKCFGVETVNKLFTVNSSEFIPTFENITHSGWNQLNVKYKKYINEL
ncbi:MAG: hypothetical protein AB9833_04250 [Bacteroidales bacterium]